MPEAWFLYHPERLTLRELWSMGGTLPGFVRLLRSAHRKGTQPTPKVIGAVKPVSEVPAPVAQAWAPILDALAELGFAHHSTGSLPGPPEEMAYRCVLVDTSRTVATAVAHVAGVPVPVLRCGHASRAVDGTLVVTSASGRTFRPPPGVDARHMPGHTAPEVLDAHHRRVDRHGGATVLDDPAALCGHLGRIGHEALVRRRIFEPVPDPPTLPPRPPAPPPTPDPGDAIDGEPSVPATIGLLGVSAAVFATTMVAPDAVLSLLADRPWGLLSSAVVHLQVWHILFNAIWIWQLGRIVEVMLRSWPRHVAFMAGCAIASSVAQLLASGTTGIGASGIVYGLFGYLWIARRRMVGFRPLLDSRDIVLLVGWLGAGVVLSRMDVLSIGNAAHAGGLAFGAAVGGLLIPPTPWWVFPLRATDDGGL